MKRILLSFCAIIAAIAFLTSCSQEWKSYEYAKDFFAVDMPGKPKEEKSFQSLSQTSALTATTYTVESLSSDESYLVYVGKYNHWDLNEVTFDQEVGRQSMRESIKQQGGSIISEGPVQLAGRDAWEFKIKVKRMEGALQVFVDDMTIYGLQELHKEGKDVSGNAKRFFSSFRLLY